MKNIWSFLAIHDFGAKNEDDKAVKALWISLFGAKNEDD